MPLFWLRVALMLYGIGLIYALVSLWGGRKVLSRIALPAVGLGVCFHFVSLTENAMMSGSWAPSSMHEMESLLAFVLMVFFFIIYARYKATAPGMAVFPLVFLLTASAAFKRTPAEPALPLFVSAQWVSMHVALILIGYSALLFSFTASILYLIQERTLKSKKIGGFWSRLPSLNTLDDIGYQCLVWGFPFMTLGLISGAIMAEARVGSQYFLDLKILTAFLTWVLYAFLLYTRGNAGWRGRKAAYLATAVCVTAILAWAANGLSHSHNFRAP
ncbi:MAG TPA: cytochrome c biogenesis protein CcsA [Candidatus Angelobacter sp.]|nr:cytochrome c biogenesis protein CcsA [Candidatus Angelobacter sp.]